MRRLALGALVATGLAGLVLVLLARWPPAAPPSPSTLDAGLPERCEGATGPVPPLRADLSAANLVFGGSVRLEVDGQAPGATLPAGLHTLRARDASVQVQVEPFAEVVVQTFEVSEVSVILFFGARCATCERAETRLELEYQRGPVASAKLLARAVAHGDWKLAVELARGLTPADRDGLEVRRLLAAVHVLAGQPTLAEGLLLQNDPLVRELATRDEREAAVPRRQLATAEARWNAVSERFERLTSAFAREVSTPMAELSRQFDGLSARFLAAKTRGDVVESELVLQEANDAVARVVSHLRARDPGCEWQRRVWSAL